MSGLQSVPDKVSFPDEEAKICRFWEEIDAFQESVRRSEGRPEYSFYDGPPFATGLPHYGHILAGTIKDIVTRYAHMTGHHVSRRFGWDCHGLPVEYEIDQALGLKTREDVHALGIERYNAECRKIVMRFATEWETVVKRMGRWIDFRNDYKTLDTPYMESVWSVFQQLYQKNLVYRGFKVMHVSTACGTPLSNFEASQNYREVQDPSVVLRFKILDDDACFLAWTTTPWTLPSNLALIVHPNIKYVRFVEKATGRVYVAGKPRLVDMLYKSLDEVQILAEFDGSELVGKRYQPLFPYWAHKQAEGAYRVIAGDFVDDKTGTCIVHCAPAHGEDDYRVALANNIIQEGTLDCLVDNYGLFSPVVTDFAGQHVKAADKSIIRYLKDHDNLFNSSTIHHEYPFCWRSDTPLISKAMASWFVRVTSLKDDLIANNKKTRWVPDTIRDGRFHNWLASSRDWSISRNRYWGTPIPLWVSEDGEEVVCIGSIAELERRTGHRPTDLHREFVDHLTIPSSRTPGTVLRRIPDTFDCWFESGSMPYAQVHHPFENVERFERTFPADFIAEGVDQTRGWFYTLMVISTALYNQPPFKNLIVNGLVLASDGRKMSKRLKNYPDPMLVAETHGCDALRLYLIDSPVVRAENLRFDIAGVRDVVKEFILRFHNAYRFLIMYALPLHFAPNQREALESSNVMDKWILTVVSSVIRFVAAEMAEYRLSTVLGRLTKFVDELTNWYLRFNRQRLKGRKGEAEQRTSLNVLFEVVYTFARVMAPFTPFIVESMYQNLKFMLPEAERQPSIHFLNFPQPQCTSDPVLERQIKRLQVVITLGRLIRDRRRISLKTPVREIIIINKDVEYLNDLRAFLPYLYGELHVKQVTLTEQEEQYVLLSAEGVPRSLGKRLGKSGGAVAAQIKSWTNDQVKAFVATGRGMVGEVEVTTDDVTVKKTFRGNDAEAVYEAATAGDGDVVMLVDIREDAQLRDEGLVYSFVNRVQKARKAAHLTPEIPLAVVLSAVPEALWRVLTEEPTASMVRFSLPGVALSRVLPENARRLSDPVDVSLVGHSFQLHLISP